MSVMIYLKMQVGELLVLENYAKKDIAFEKFNQAIK